MGRLDEESPIFYLSGYLLKINFTFDLYFATQNAEIYGPLMSHDYDMIEESDIPRVSVSNNDYRTMNCAEAWDIKNDKLQFMKYHFTPPQTSLHHYFDEIYDCAMKGQLSMICYQ